RYAYVEGNPVARTDPTGHCFSDGSGGCAFLNPNTGVTKYITPQNTVVLIPAVPGFTRIVRPVPSRLSPPTTSKGGGTRKSNGKNPSNACMSVVGMTFCLPRVQLRLTPEAEHFCLGLPEMGCAD